MSEERQIEEMAQIIRNRLPHIGRACVEGECIKGDKNSVYETPCWCVYKEIAEMLYNAGYRRQSEVIKEFVKRFEGYIGNYTFTMGQANNIQYALKKATEEAKGGAE